MGRQCIRAWSALFVSKEVRCTYAPQKFLQQVCLALAMALGPVVTYAGPKDETDAILQSKEENQWKVGLIETFGLERRDKARW